jgi:hypothetical protein
MSFAGFAGLFLAMRARDSEWHARDTARVKAIVTFALTALFGALVVVPLSSLVSDASAIRAVSAALLVVEFYGHQIRLGTAWSRWSQVEQLSRRDLIVTWAPFMVVAIVEQLLLLVCVLQPSAELYALALIAMLGTPALVFVLVASQVSTGTGSSTRSG